MSGEPSLQHLCKFSDSSLVARGDLEDFSRDVLSGSSCSLVDRVDQVGGEDEVTSGGAVAIDLDGLSLYCQCDPLSNNAGLVSTLGSVDVAESEGHGLDIKGLGIGRTIRLSSQFAGTVGRDWLGHDLFVNGRLDVARRSAAAGEDEPLRRAMPGGLECVESALDIGAAVEMGVPDRVWHASAGREVNDHVSLLRRCSNPIAIENVADDQLDATRPRGICFDFIEGCYCGEGFAGADRQVVVDANRTSVRDERLNQVAADEAATTRDEPVSLVVFLAAHFTPLKI